MLSICLTNLGKYNEGELIYQRLDLPCSYAKYKEALINIGIDNIRYEEYFISDYECDIEGVMDNIGSLEYANFDEVNLLAYSLKKLDEREIKLLEAILEYESSISIKDIVNYTYNLDNYILAEDVKDKEEFGHYLVEELGCYEIPDEIAEFIDYEKIGESMLYGAGMITKKGYLEVIDESVNEVYTGLNTKELLKDFMKDKGGKER